MKLFTTLSAAAVVSAQFDGFANLNDLFASLQNDLITTDAVTADSVRTNEDPATTTEDAATVSSLFLSFKLIPDTKLIPYTKLFQIFLQGSSIHSSDSNRNDQLGHNTTNASTNC